MARINRRDVLKGMLGGAVVSVGLPPLECFFNSNGTAYANGLLPTRFGVWTWGNGVVPERWIPEQVGAEYELSEELAPLESIRQHINVLTGYEVRVPNTIPHFSGACGMLSAVAAIGEEGDNTFAAPSIDQVIADEIGGTTRFRSLELGAGPGEGLSANGPYSKNPPESDPHALFERLFGVGFREPGSDAPPDPRIGLRRSVLDVVLDRSKDLQSKLGAADKARLDQHLEGIRALELQLARMQEDPPDLAACVAPTAPAEGMTWDWLSERQRALNDLLVMALACDQTRVFMNNFTYPVSNWVFPQTNAGHHQLTHDEPGDQPMVHSIVLQIMEEFRVFVESLAAVEEGDGTLLDHCAILATSDVSFGRVHGLDEFPILTAGTASGALKTGLHVRSNRDNATKVLVTMQRAMGMIVGSFGEGDCQASDGVGDIEA